MDVKEKRTEDDLTCARMEALIKTTEMQILEYENMRREFSEDLRHLLIKRDEKNKTLQAELSEVRASIPDFDEETYQKYKAFYDKEKLIEREFENANAEVEVLTQNQERCFARIEFLKTSLMTFKEKLRAFNSEKAIS